MYSRIYFSTLYWANLRPKYHWKVNRKKTVSWTWNNKLGGSVLRNRVWLSWFSGERVVDLSPVLAHWNWRVYPTMVQCSFFWSTVIKKWTRYTSPKKASQWLTEWWLPTIALKLHVFFLQTWPIISGLSHWPFSATWL